MAWPGCGIGVACGRLLKFLNERGIKTTWFTPGFTIESWPKESAAVAEGGPQELPGPPRLEHHRALGLGGGVVHRVLVRVGPQAGSA